MTNLSALRRWSGPSYARWSRRRRAARADRDDRTSTSGAALAVVWPFLGPLTMEPLHILRVSPIKGAFPTATSMDIIAKWAPCERVTGD